MKPSVRELSATGCGADRAPRPTLFAVGALLFLCSALFLISANLPAVAAAHAGNQYSRVGLVQQGEDGRSYCQRDSADLLADGAADLHVRSYMHLCYALPPSPSPLLAREKP